jgi:hypothetical protein
MALALLYRWLIGHWFARVLMLIALVPLLGFGGAALFAQMPGDPTGDAVIGGIIGAVLAWPVAGLPVYWWRRQLNRLPIGKQYGY